MRLFTAGLLVALLGQADQSRSGLPPPTGAHPVGRATIELTDSSRRDPDDAAHTIAVDVWYPAESSAAPAAYLPAAVFENPEAARRLRGYLRSAFDAIRQGDVNTYAGDRATFARSIGRAPLLVFSHGGGEMKETYSGQLADLASHGFVVAAIAHAFDAAVAIRTSGHALLLPKRWPSPATSTVEGVPPSQLTSPEQLRWWADDIRLVADRLTDARA